MRGWLNLVDFYKVSLAARDGLGLMLARVRCHTDSTESTDFSACCARIFSHTDNTDITDITE